MDNLQHNVTSSNYQPFDKSDEIDIKSLLMILRSRIWWLIGATLLGFVLAMLSTLFIVPKYKASALIQVNDQTSSSNVLGSLYMGVARATPSQIQQALLKSRFVLTPVIKELGLNISASPHYFPLIGKVIAQHHSGHSLAKPWLGFDQFAWGGERIHIGVFNVDGALFDHHPFTLTAKKDHQFDLYGPNGEFVLSGHVGLLSVSKKYPDTSILVSQLVANPGEEFTVALSSVSGVVGSIQGTLAITDMGSNERSNSWSQDTGILNVSLEWSNRNTLPLILNKIVDTAVQKSIQHQSQEAAKSLTFIQQQIPGIRKKLEKAELALNNYRSKKGIVDMSSEGQMLLQEVAKESEAVQEIKMQKALLLRSFTSRHPLILALNDKLAGFRESMAELEMRIRALPHTDQGAMSLMRDVKVKETLYSSLLAKVQQLQVIKAGTVGDVQILNYSTVPLSPLSMHKSFIVFAGGIAGFMLAAILILVQSLLFGGVSDPEEIEAQTNIPVQAVVPFSQKQDTLAKQAEQVSGGAFQILARTDPKDTAVEALRSLRTSVQLHLKSMQNNVINILGASPGVGKSFISINLAHLLADVNKKVVLIDCDMRKGKLHRHFNIKRLPGLSEYLSKKAQIEDVVHNVYANLDFISCGNYPGAPSELLSGARFDALIDTLSEQYGVVMLDTPPIMAVTDAIVIGQRPALNFLLVGLGKNQLQEIQVALKRLQKNNVQASGLICNYFSKSAQYYAASSYNYYYYHYNYK